MRSIRKALELTAGAVIVLWLLGAVTARADTRRFVLNPGSSITSVCNSCAEPPSAPESLTGSFAVTTLPISTVYDMAAVTDVKFTSATHAITGNGFLQRLGADRQALVLDALVDDVKVLFTSGRRQYAGPRDLTIILSSRRDRTHSFVLVISASPVDEEIPDADADTVADAQDNCPHAANPGQSDADGDRVGDPCDQCPDSSSSDLINRHGCSLAQLCPCDATVAGEPWPSQREYLRCAARVTRRLRAEGLLSRSQSLNMLRRAARSGCGRTILASR